MSLSAIEKILENATGLDSNSIGINIVHRIVKARMNKVGIDDVESYHAKLTQDKSELQALIEDVTVPETWFFRDREPFELLSELIRTECGPPSKDKVLRILSVPCATGEEAYSIAMLMSDLGFDSETLRIDAVDISKRALTRAAKAEYRENSFRGDEGDYLRRFFDKTNEGYRLHDAIRRMVGFWHGNLLDEKFLAGVEMYDVIFCRNVMIYFTRDLQAKAVKKLYRLLAVNGLLFVGHAESTNLSGEYFASIRRAGAFAFRKKIPGVSKVVNEPPVNLKMAVNAGSIVQRGRTDSSGRPKVRPKKSRKSSVKEVVSAGKEPVLVEEIAGVAILKKIRRMADEGLLQEASSLCEHYLEGDAGSAEAYYLLGLIREAEAKDAEAGNLFRKAVYLDPRHYEALIHLAVLAEAQGNLAAAAVYRARASRLSNES